MKEQRGKRFDLPIEKIKDGVYRLNEFDGTNCYLVVGTEKALLIDSGTGFCDLRRAVEGLTDLPVVHVATHGHGDHFGGRGQFPSVYVHADDCKRINRLQGSMLFRKIFVTFNAPVRANGFCAKDVLKPEYKTEILPMEEGYAFELGGKSVVVKHTPGHSKGSVALVDEADKTVFSGDTVCDAVWMFLPGSTTIEEWIPSVEWVLEMSKTYDVYWGHRVAHLTTEYIATVLGWAKELVAKTKRNALFSTVAQYPKQPDGIIYRTGRVLKKK